MTLDEYALRFQHTPLTSKPAPEFYQACVDTAVKDLGEEGMQVFLAQAVTARHDDAARWIGEYYGIMESAGKKGAVVE